MTRLPDTDIDADLERLLTGSRPQRREPAPSKPAAPSLGFLDPRTVERWFVRGVYFVMFVLVILSLLGTFYGLQHQAAPLLQPAQMVLDLAVRPWALLWTLVLQGGLTLAQYGARVKARTNRRWWLGYLAALGVSVYYNLQAYYDPVVALGVPWLLAIALIIAGDVLPEHVAIRHS
jgi:hypothetical protein